MLRASVLEHFARIVEFRLPARACWLDLVFRDDLAYSCRRNAEVRRDVHDGGRLGPHALSLVAASRLALKAKLYSA